MPTLEAAPTHPLLMPPETQEIGPESLTPLKVLEARRDMGVKPGEEGYQPDEFKVGLALDPGGYAGVVSLAMAAELDKQGLLDYVDGYYGVSVGNINALYVATRQFDEGLQVYTDLMPGRFKSGRRKGLIPQTHLDVLEQAILRDRPFKPEKLPKNAPITIGVTRLENFGKVKVRSNEVPIDEFIQWALRGCHLPITMDPPKVAEDGYHYSDSTLSWMSAIELAEEDNCTHVISMANVLPKDRSFIAAATPLSTDT